MACHAVQGQLNDNLRATGAPYTCTRELYVQPASTSRVNVPQVLLIKSDVGTDVGTRVLPVLFLYLHHFVPKTM